MRIHGHIVEPKDVEVTLTITATVAEWRQFHEQLAATYPSWKVASGITQVLRETMGRVSVEHVEAK